MTAPKNAPRLFCKVLLAGEMKDYLVLLTTDSDRIPAPDQFGVITMHDLKMGKTHLFNADRVIHVQFEAEREGL